MATATYDSNYVLLGHATKVQVGYSTNLSSLTAGNCPSVGYTEGPIQVNMEVVYYRANPDQAMGPVKAAKGAESCTVSIPFAEMRLTNLAKALGYSASGLTSIFNFGGDQTTRFYKIFVTGPGPSGGDQRWAFHKTIPNGSKTFEMKRGDGSVVLNATFECFQDTSLSAGKQTFSLDQNP